MNFLRGCNKDKQTEAQVLKHFKKRASTGGVWFKISDRYMTGFSDLIYIMEGSVWFIELKAKGKRPSPAQAAIGLRIQSEGANWVYLDSIKAVDLFFDKIS